MMKSSIKTVTLATIFHKPADEANQYVRFYYGPQKICNHTRGKTLVSIHVNPVNEKYTGQHSTKEALGDELEGYFG